VARILLRLFLAGEVDDVRRRLGQAKDMAHSGQQPTVREQVLALRRQGHGLSHIARETSLSRKQVARVLALSKASNDRNRGTIPEEHRLPAKRVTYDPLYQLDQIRFGIEQQPRPSDTGISDLKREVARCA
jgi:hypothetical protein